MDLKQKKNILSHLARKAKDDPSVQNAVEKEANKAIDIMHSETLYDAIEEQIEVLDVISYRVHTLAFEAYSRLIKRLETIELTHPEISGYPKEWMSKYRNSQKLIVSTLKVLQRIRYHEPEKCLDIFFELSTHKDEDIRKQAIEGIESLANYDLDIFYGDGNEWPGLGWEPQDKVLAKIRSFDRRQRRKFLTGILAACGKMLSPTIEGTKWSYNKVALTTVAVPPIGGIKELRAKVLEILKAIYFIAESLDDKRRVLGVMTTATRFPQVGGPRDEVQTMIIANTLAVLEFMRDNVSKQDMQIMQKIEHDAYWLYYHLHAHDTSIAKVALEIRDVLTIHKEYQIFRALIGFESIFHEWEGYQRKDEDYDRERKFRESEALRLSREINHASYNVWKKRIVDYASIKSNDMATFPYFGKFLENFGKESPALALKFLDEESSEIQGFLVAILSGIAATEHKLKAYQQIAKWVADGKYLFSMARFFEFAKEVDFRLLKSVFEKAKREQDINALSQIIASVAAQYSSGKEDLVETFFIPCIRELTEYKSTGWIFGFWFRAQQSELILALKESDCKIVLDNLFWLPEIDYQAEEILCQIAKKAPELVVEFFCRRLSFKDQNDVDSKFEPVPFDFHDLAAPLSSIPEKAVDAVREQYNDDYGLFVFGGAKLLKNIFPAFSERFGSKLIQLAQTRDESNILFVMAILRNYEGQPFLHQVCKELVRSIPEDDKLLGEIRVILQSTGVVSGEYGFVQTYKRKIEEIKPWLEDSDSKIVDFAENYISGLERQVEAEKRRADEGIELRKHQYGEDPDESQ